MGGLVTFLHEGSNMTDDENEPPGCPDPVLGVFLGSGPENAAPAVSPRTMILMAIALAWAGVLILRRRKAKRPLIASRVH